MDNRARLGRLYEQQRQVAKAGEIYQGIYADSPDKLPAARLLAGFYLRTGRKAEAEKLLNDLLASSSDKVGAYIVYADYLAQSNPDQAKAAVTKAIETDPNDPRARVALAALLVQRRDWAGAADAMSNYLALHPAAPAAAAAALDIVRYRINAGQLSQAEEQLQPLLNANPSDADLLTLKGNLALKQGNASQAMEAYNRALQIVPAQVEAMLGQANVYLTQGNPTEAKMALAKARGASKDPQIAMILADLHMRLGEVDKASMVLREVLSQPETANYAPAMKQLLSIYEQQQRWPKVVELLTEAKAKFPNDPYYPTLEARMYRQTGDRTRAVTATEAALALAPQSPDALVGYLLMLVEAGDLNKVLSVTDNYRDKPIYGPIPQAILCGRWPS